MMEFLLLRKFFACSNKHPLASMWDARDELSMERGTHWLTPAPLRHDWEIQRRDFKHKKICGMQLHDNK